ncbi:type III-A CRISPR-associated RAMP protein Csm3 [Pseudoramibacter faecis]|uniref:type III-A CRISPR-associated RAMP protein Csm3 n=1 Tax=Pseudoramibacter faecis TaxID=3108534 RepID=UPI002E77DDE0|nr:type III-A CRISPR-associated RAMP protein Csm3 [Pseudoramibacter sp. HA2172]
MFGKIQITGQIKVVTGMHIGGSTAFAAIGAVDAPVVRDVHTNLPMIPGSSLKGKMRALLAREYNETLAKTPDYDDERILRLFGSAQKNNVRRSRLIFSDLFLANEKELRDRGLSSMVEIKFENTINRATAVANPRQLERVVRGSIFDLNLIYDLDRESDSEEIEADMATLAEGMRLLQMDYLGGSGTRGYGKIRFLRLAAQKAIGDLPADLMARCDAIIQGAQADSPRREGPQ